MTRRVDTDMTCSRGKAGIVGYAAVACCFCRIISQRVQKRTGHYLLSAISPYRLQPHFLDASNFACHSDPRPSLAPGRPPVLAAPKTCASESSHQQKASLKRGATPGARALSATVKFSIDFVRRCAGYALLAETADAAALLIPVMDPTNWRFLCCGDREYWIY